VIGLDPYRVPGPWDPEPVAHAITESMTRLADHGFDAETCLFGLDGSDDIETVVTSALRSRPWHCVLIGGGVRKSEDLLELFESVVNLARRHAPDAAIAFNRTPVDIVDAIERSAAGPGSAMTEPSRADLNRRNVQAFYDLMFNQCRPSEAIERYAGDTYTQHNPHVGDGKEAFVAYFERMAAEYPGKRVEFVRAIAEDDYVVLHCRQTWPGDHDYAGIDVFRLDGAGRIVEHWDVLQVVPDHSANENGLF
jgi:predicted SnoaL-like aldol condensation-catalyzing enzyme